MQVSTLRCGRNNPGSNPGHGIRVFVKKRPTLGKSLNSTVLETLASTLDRHTLLI